MADLAGINGLRENFKVVGQRNLPGVLSHALATGVAKFGIDYVRPDMLHAKFLHSPYANARVLSVDTTKARSMPGVVDILTWEDEDIVNLVSYAEHWGAPRPWLDNIADQEGAEVAVIVVAESEDICEEALRQLQVEWEMLPHVVDLHEGKKTDAFVIRPQDRSTPAFGAPAPGALPNPPKQGNVAYSNVIQGDIEEGFKQADHIVQYDMYMPAFASLIPNPPGSVAWWSNDFYHGEGKTLHIEGAVRERLPIARMYDMPLEKTVQEGLFMGGRYCDWGLRRSQEITPLLAKRTGRPVRCVMTREETFDSVIMKQRYMYLKVGFTKEGLITAIDDFSVSDGGIWGSSTFGHVGDQKQGPYNTLKCKNISQRMEIVDSNRYKMWVSGQHTPFNWDIVTLALYMISEKLGMDPIEVARLNLHGPSSKDDINPVPSFEACVAAGKTMMDWNWHLSGTKKLPDGRMHGMSFRYQMCPRHSVSGYKCRLEFRDGAVHMPTQGPVFGAYMVEPNAMVAAEELGLTYEDIKVDFHYAAKFSPVGGGSDGSTASAWAMKECANSLKKQILEAAIEYAESWPQMMMTPLNDPPPPEPGPFKGLRPDELDITDGKIYVKADPEKSVPLAQATNRDLVATYSGRPPLAAWLVGGCGNILDTMNAVFCEVAVDTDTGDVEILRFGAVVDPGKALRPTSLESQIDQVMFFSQGSQLLEDFVFDQRTGVKLNSNMIDYKKPTMLDVPVVEHALLETRSGNGAYGASGISHSMANTHLVITAIHNAVGVWVDPPATPDKVLAALGKA
ncbi:MAG: xanthine dehydrogenase family protein molybdopterin-binding subunit [Clostridiales bacterium]|nr:xanthine dehydrogenase family protein molybdopterin-binding subunit [Clostridiales bacterium]